MTATFFISFMLGIYTFLFVQVGQGGYATHEVIMLTMISAMLTHVFFVRDVKYRDNKGKPPLNHRTDVVFNDGSVMKGALTSKLDWSLSAERSIASFQPKALISF